MIKKKSIQFLQLFSLVVLLLSVSCTAQETEHVRVIGQSDYIEMVAANPNIQLVDVRTPEEYAAGYIDQAVNLDFYSEDFVQRCKEEFSVDQPIVVYCKSGGRSAKASAQLEEAGFQTIYDVKGGYSAWNKN